MELLITGLRAFESRKRTRSMKMGDISQIEWRGRERHYLYSPIFFWKNEEVENYLKEHSLPINPNYQILNFSGECICGVQTNKQKLLRIAEEYPEFFEKFIELEKKFRRGGSAFYDHTRKERIYASQLVKNNSSLPEFKTKTVS
ncbi:MAG: phosphoadenosine phosphosulfate reductase domain-containing protein [Candidatus Methanospirareceae archaeon]